MPKRNHSHDSFCIEPWRCSAAGRLRLKLTFGLGETLDAQVPHPCAALIAALLRH